LKGGDNDCGLLIDWQEGQETLQSLQAVTPLLVALGDGEGEPYLRIGHGQTMCWKPCG